MVGLFLTLFGGFYLLAFILGFIPYIIFMFICYKIAMNKGYPKWMTLFGLFGIMGVILMIILPGNDVSERDKRNYNKFNKKDPFASDFDNWKNKKPDGNRFDSEQEEERTYYYNGDTYYYNGEKVKKTYKKCKYCGASLDKKASFCTVCRKDV